MVQELKLELEPIGFVRSPFVERSQAPRQATLARDSGGVLELLPGKHFEDALHDLSGFRFIWVLYWFHLNQGWRPKVLPQRSPTKRGVFATRSPRRPNPIGQSLVELVKVDGLTLHVAGLDMLDGTPVLDIKPYLNYADAPPLLKPGQAWTEENQAVGLTEGPHRYQVHFAEAASEALQFLESRGVALRGVLEQTLSLGPFPHAYRRIKAYDGYSIIAHKEWRARFRTEASLIVVESVTSGYRRAEWPALKPGSVAREFIDRFGERAETLAGT